MDLNSYTGIIAAVTGVPCVIIFLIGGLLWSYYRKSDKLILLVMKNIISRKNIERTPRYLICNRVLKPSHRKHFMLASVYIIALCAQCFFIISIVDVSYECTHDPNVDCFKKKDDVKISDAYPYNESPVNCSSISRDDLVVCYEITAFDPGRAFLGAAAAYILFKMVNFALLVTGYVMLWAVKKWEEKTLLHIKIAFCLTLLVGITVPLMLRVYLDEVESAFRKVSYTVFIQALLVAVVIIYFITNLPWNDFSESEEYFGDASLPLANHGIENEMI